MRRLVGYVRVGPRERVSRRPGLDRQRGLIADRCRREGWTLLGVEQDVRSGRTLRRPGLQAALETCRRENAGIIVAALDRLTYSLDDLARLARELRQDDIALVALDPSLDTATEAGALVLNVLAEAATWTPRSLVRRARSKSAGAAPGRPPSIPDDLADRIRALRGKGATLQAICDVLNAEGVPTPRGGSHWRPTSLRAVLRPRTRGGSR
ncbi:MAG TPA: recombinase family protein [Gaiellaceae bacterium]|nr:recombinase family protein [Gaiellaceae bacterium]